MLTWINQLFTKGPPATMPTIAYRLPYNPLELPVNPPDFAECIILQSDVDQIVDRVGPEVLPDFYNHEARLMFHAGFMTGKTWLLNRAMREQIRRLAEMPGEASTFTPRSIYEALYFRDQPFHKICHWWETLIDFPIGESPERQLSEIIGYERAELRASNFCGGFMTAVRRAWAGLRGRV